MNEQEPKHQEWSGERVVLLERLRHSPDDQEALEALGRWIRELEDSADPVEAGRAAARVNYEKAKMFLAAGFESDAWENATAAWQQAKQENDEALAVEAEQLMNEIDSPPK
ncbi:MAG TPA: hypothetical protein VMC43_00220 [Candidatus Paceibacterota bacterium]|nr:hypothetical protein [Candidatus Paceibacterota bacterium]